MVSAATHVSLLMRPGSLSPCQLFSLSLVYAVDRLEKNELHELRGVNFVFGFSTKLVHFSANFGSLNVKIRNNFKNVIFIACKWCKICKYYVYSMVISLSPVKRKKKNAFGLNIWFTLFCCEFKFVVIYAFFPPNLYSQNFRVYKKMIFSRSAHTAPWGSAKV